MGNSDYESGLTLTTPWRFQISYDWKKLIAYMKLLTNEIAKFFQASYIEMISLLKSKYIVRLAHQLVGFEQLLSVFKKAVFEKIISFIRLFRTKKTMEQFFSTQARSEILFVLETTCHGILWLWVSLDLNNYLTFWKSYLWEIFFAYMQLLTNQTTVFSEASQFKNARCFGIYIPCGTLIMSLVWYEQLLDFFK